MNNETSKSLAFFLELERRLQDAGFEASITEDGNLAVTHQELPICSVDIYGNIRYPAEQKSRADFFTRLGQAAGLVQSTARYMELLEKAPLLDAYGLQGDYRLLSKFNGVVLAAHPTEYGVQFITWEQSTDGKSLWGGHYHSCHYEAAKKDFAARSKLVPSAILFTDEQLAEIYRVCSDTLETACDLSCEQEKILGSIQSRVEELIPEIISQTRGHDQAQFSQQQTF